MSGENIETAAYRRKRIQWIKRCVIYTIFLLILLPTALCIHLFVRMRKMDGELKELTGQLEMLSGETASQLETLSEETASQREILQEILENIRTTGQGRQAESDASLKFTGYELTVPNEPEESDTAETFESPEPDTTATHKVYLTFDDGPSANTEKILDILDEYDIKATFFVVGKEDETARNALVQIVERGHTLGMHSYSHKYAEIYSSEEDFAADFEKIRNYLEEVTGVTSNIYRFPGGSSNKVSKLDMRVFIDYLESEDVVFFDWNISSGDAVKTPLTVDELIENATRGIEKRETSVILMHDALSKTTTLEALPMIIETILAMEDTVILPITEDTMPVQHIKKGD